MGYEGLLRDVTGGAQSHQQGSRVEAAKPAAELRTIGAPAAAECPCKWPKWPRQLLSGTGGCLSPEAPIL